MPQCMITGCKHRVKHTIGSRHISESWRDWRICSCCAVELFPKGYEPDRGTTHIYTVGFRCKQALKKEAD